MWLNEGFATYAEWLCGEDHGGVTAQKHFEDAFADKGNWDLPARRSAGEQPPGRTGVRAWRDGPAQDPPGRRRRRLLRPPEGLAADHRHGNASTDDFVAYVEKTSGKDLTALWDVWLYGEDKPAKP